MTAFIGIFDTARDYTLRFTVTHTHTLSSTHWCLYCRCSVTASNGGHSPSSGFPNCPRPYLSASNSNSWKGLNRSHSKTNSPTNSSLRWLPGWRPPHTNLLLFWLNSTLCPAYNISSLIVVAQLLRWEHASFRSCYSVTAVVFLFILRSLPSYGSTCHNIV
jgi:hypothetical protein